MKNKTLLGAVSAYAVDVTAPEAGGVVSVTPNAQSGQPNADGTYNINLPAEFQSSKGPTVALKPEDVTTNTADTGEEVIVDEAGGNGDDEGGMKKYLPWIIGGGLLLFFFMRKK
jgi:hypothetical protein